MWEVDNDGDGHYDTRMTGQKADQAYWEWVGRRAQMVPELVPTPDPQALAGARATVWHVYECPPISLWSEGVVTVDKRLEMLTGTEAVRVDSFVLLFEAAVELVADLTSYDGDGTWVVAAVPDVERGEMCLMFLVDQSADHPRRKDTQEPDLHRLDHRAALAFSLRAPRRGGFPARPGLCASCPSHQPHPGASPPGA